MRVDKNKLYAGMSLEERARLAFKFTVSNDEARLDDILATVPKKTYITNHAGFHIRSNGLYYAALTWGFEYQKQQGLNTTFLGLLAAIDKDTSDLELRQLRIDAGIKYKNSCDKLEILFSLLDELDDSHGLDSNSVYAIAEVRCLAVGNCILDIDGDIPARTPQVLINHDTKNKNDACSDYYSYCKELLLQMLNQYENLKDCLRESEY